MFRKVTLTSSLQRRNRRGETAEALVNISGMAAYSNIWKAIPYEACSGDESEYDEDNQKELVVTQLGWRNREVRGWMQVWDDLNLKIQITRKAGGMSGRLPYPRYDPEDRPRGRARPESHRYQAPSGLPRNFYSPDYLRDLTDVQRDSLNLQPPISLQFPPAILR